MDDFEDDGIIQDGLLRGKSSFRRRHSDDVAAVG